MPKVFGALGSGVLVYVVVSACSGSSGGAGSAKKQPDASVSSGGSAGMAGLGGGAGATGAAGASPEDSGGALDALGDALTDPVPDAMANESGSRLKARRYVGADGSKEWLGWHDSKRGINCMAAVADDGKTRCMPTAVIAVYFSDSACTQALALVQDCTAPKEVSRYTQTTCPAGALQYSGWTVGSATTPATVYSLTTSAPVTCKAAAWSGVPGYTLHALTKVDSSEYLELTEVVDN